MTDNTCNSNDIGISLVESDSNAVANNTCNSNDIGISLDKSHYSTVMDSDNNTVTYNTCNNNRIGIYIYSLGSNTVADNTCLGNTEHDIVNESELEELAHQEFVAREFAWLLGGLGMTLVVSVIVFVQFRRMEL